MLIVQSDAFNRSRIGTIIVAAITSNTSRAEAPGNVSLPKGTARLPRPSVVNVAHVLTLNREDLVARVGQLPPSKMAEVDEGLRLSLSLS